MSTRGLFRNPFRAHNLAGHRPSSYPNQNYVSNDHSDSDCPLQQQQVSGQNQRTSSSQRKTVKDRCLCCTYKFSFIERLLSLGQKRCHECRQIICKRCTNFHSPGLNLCDVCRIKQRFSTQLNPNFLLNVDERELATLLRSIHFKETEISGWSKSYKIKQLYNKLGIYTDWEPSNTLSPNTNGKSPKRKRRPSHDSSDAKRVKTIDSSMDQSVEDLRTIQLADPVVNVETNSPLNQPNNPPPSTSQSHSQEQQHQRRRQTPRRSDSTVIARKWAANLRRSMSKGTTTTQPIRRRKRGGSGASLPIEDLCKICMDTTPNCVFLNCGHMVSCHKCAHLVSECPICRSDIVKVQKVYKS